MRCYKTADAVVREVEVDHKINKKILFAERR